MPRPPRELGSYRKRLGRPPVAIADRIGWVDGGDIIWPANSKQNYRMVEDCRVQCESRQRRSASRCRWPAMLSSQNALSEFVELLRCLHRFTSAQLRVVEVPQAGDPDRSRAGLQYGLR